jgi:type IV pilus assembly protein PilE
MVVVAIVAILAAIAYPSYTNYIVRSNRSAAQGYMLEVSSLQHRFMLDARSFGNSVSTSMGGATVAPTLVLTVPSSVQASYAVVTAPKTGTTPPGFTVTATPIGSQLARDTSCGTLGIDETGAKSASGALGVSGCW